MSAMDPQERESLRRLPKAELHLHLEGSLTAETLWRLSQRQGHPHGLTTLEECRQLYSFADFAGFIRAIKTASQHLVAPADYAEAVLSLARQLQAQGVVYAEVFLSIGILLWRQVAVEPYIEAVTAATARAAEEAGVRLAWIYDAVRQFGPEPFAQVVQHASTRRLSNECIGVGIGGDESQVPSREFARGFDAARDHGLRTTIHAGETCGPESVREAIDWLRPDRIGHGLHAVEDPALVDRIAREGIAVDICPVTNFKTGAWPTSKPHPVRYLYDSRVAISISTDDPGIFACTLMDQYAYLREHAGFSADELRQVVQGAWNNSFLTEPNRRAMMRLPTLAAPNPGGD